MPAVATSRGQGSQVLGDNELSEKSQKFRERSDSREMDDMLDMTDAQTQVTQARRTDRREYRLLMALTVTCFLIVSMVSRLMPRSLRPFASVSQRRESCLGEARRMAQAVIPYAFEW